MTTIGTDELKDSLTSSLWNVDESYYTSAAEGSEDFGENYGLLTVQRYCQRSPCILDCGCGEGTKLSKMAGPVSQAYGVDISRLATSIARDKYPQLRLVQGDVEELPFTDESFDAVYSAYTLEHLSAPQKVIDEMIRVTRLEGYVIFIGPNYGSPLYFSPCGYAVGNFKRKLLRRLWQSHRYLLFPPNSLRWENVEPLALSEGRYEMDWDTVVEPYLHTLLLYLARKGLQVIEYSSMFDATSVQRVPILKLIRSNQGEVIRKICKRLSDWGLPPYKFYGPNFYVIAQKT